MFYIWHEFGEPDSINLDMILRKMLLQSPSLTKSYRFSLVKSVIVSGNSDRFFRTEKKFSILESCKTFEVSFQKFIWRRMNLREAENSAELWNAFKSFWRNWSLRKNRELKIFSCLFLNSSELDFWLFVKSKTELKAREGTLWLRLQFTSLKLKTVWFSINYM